MPLLPKPYPDEVFGSVIARGCRHAGLGLKRMLAFMYGSQRSYVSLLMSSDPRRDGMLAGVDAEELIRKHTVLPYATAFFPAEQQAQFREKALRLNTNESLSSLVQNLSTGVPMRRTCQDCIAQDLQRFGESYWRRAHLLPGVEICTVHRRQLLRTALPVRGKAQSNRLAMPDEVAGRAAQPYVPMSITQALAAISDDALQERIPPLDNVCESYRQRALGLGYSIADGIAASRALALDLRKVFGDPLLRDMGASWSLTRASAWPALMVSGRPGQTHRTPRHVLMEAFRAMEKPAAFDRDEVYQLPGPQTRNYEALDIRAAKAVELAIKRASNRGERCGVREILDGIGLWSAYRHDRTRFPKTAAALDALRHSDQALRQAGRRPVWRKRLGLDRNLDK